MWIAKGTLLGFWLFGFGTMAWLYFALYRNLRPNSAVSISVFSGLTTANPYWWAALALCLVLGLAIARSWAASVRGLDTTLHSVVPSQCDAQNQLEFVAPANEAAGRRKQKDRSFDG